MRKFEYTIRNEVGIHARPAGMIVKKAKQYQSRIFIGKGNKKAEATKLMAVMRLCIKCGQTVEVEITGSDEDRTYTDMKRFFEENL